MATPPKPQRRTEGTCSLLSHHVFLRILDDYSARVSLLLLLLFVVVVVVVADTSRSPPESPVDGNIRIVEEPQGRAILRDLSAQLRAKIKAAGSDVDDEAAPETLPLGVHATRCVEAIISFTMDQVKSSQSFSTE